MSLDPSGSQRSQSPASSGRSSPINRLPRRTEDGGIYKKDKSFRRYASGIERALALFDSAQQEWADYISFLGRLSKAIQGHPPDLTIVPHTSTVATRLSQCLNPSLPSGVHQKALEVYAYIFHMIGTHALSRDFHVYFPGLSPVLSFASLSVRPLYLALFEDHILKLEAHALRPALKAIILSLLPGLEDQTSEDFERTYRVLDNLREATNTTETGLTDDSKSVLDDVHFWQCFFLATVTSPTRRQGALAYLARRLPKLGRDVRVHEAVGDGGTEPDLRSSSVEAVLFPEPGLLVRCFSTGLTDSQLLIQRGFLDLLVTHVPLDSPVLQDKVQPDDLRRLVAAAAGVVLRRDMSLNRRLWGWLLGPEDGLEGSNRTQDADADAPKRSPTLDRSLYFSEFGLGPLRDSLLAMIRKETTIPAERARPLRISLSLMDKWEIGGILIPDIFLPALDAVMTFCDTKGQEEVDEVMKSANIFFDGVESGLIWGSIAGLIASGLEDTSKEATRLKNLRLARFIMTKFNVREHEMLVVHMPLVLLATVVLLNSVNDTSKTAQSIERTEILKTAHGIADFLAQSIPDRSFVAVSSVAEGKDAEISDLQKPSGEILAAIRSFYTEHHGNLELSRPPFTTRSVGELLLRESSISYRNALLEPRVDVLLSVKTKLICTLAVKVPKSAALGQAGLQDTMTRACAIIRSSPEMDMDSQFSRATSSTSILSVLRSVNCIDSYIGAKQSRQVVQDLVYGMWVFLNPLNPKFHVEAVRSLWQLHAVYPNGVLEAIISTTLLCTSENSNQPSLPDINAARKFTIFWSHTLQAYESLSDKALARRNSGMPTPLDQRSVEDPFRFLTRPLLLLLDSLAIEESDCSVFVGEWVRTLPTIHHIFDLLVARLRKLAVFNPSASELGHDVRQLDDSASEAVYYFRHISGLLRLSADNVWACLADHTVQDWNSPGDVPLQALLIKMSTYALTLHVSSVSDSCNLHLVSLSILSTVLQSPYSAALKALHIEEVLLSTFAGVIDTADALLQNAYLRSILLSLRLRSTQDHLISDERSHQRKLSKDTTTSSTGVPSLNEKSQPPSSGALGEPPPPSLIACLQRGFSSSASRLCLDNWVSFLADVLPLYSQALFQNLIPLVERLCKEISRVFGFFKVIFSGQEYQTSVAPESTLLSLLNAVEQLLARAHELLVQEEERAAAVKTPEQPQGFFGNMVSGVFNTDTQISRTATANSRLTVLLSFQDTIRVCFKIWSWSSHLSDQTTQDANSAASHSYVSLRLRNRARRILEHLFAAEALECLETFAFIWWKASTGTEDVMTSAVFSVLHVLDGSRPKNTIPAIFNALYSRTNPSALDRVQLSTLTSELTDMSLAAFLVDYTESLEDDAMDEIWPDCVTFLRDVLTNPMPHRQVLPALLEFTSVIAQKVDNTNFGEQRKMRRDLADIFMRLLTATFTTRPSGYFQEVAQAHSSEGASSGEGENHTAAPAAGKAKRVRSLDLISVLALVVPKLQLVVIDNDRVATVASSISSSILVPALRTKHFPENMSNGILQILMSISKLMVASKSWKKDVFDMFNDFRFFNSHVTSVEAYWLPILRQWSLVDKDRLVEMLSRIAPPATAGIVFGVGANSARLEADKKTQLNLRRIATLLVAGTDDAFAVNVPNIQEKIIDLLTASATSSPSSITRAEVFMVIRAMLLKISPVHLAPFWPVINAELQKALSSLLPDSADQETYNLWSVLQACKLLDTLVVLAPDDFQLFEWLFITDTIDAVYRPADFNPVALADEVSDALSGIAGATSASSLLHSGDVSGYKEKTVSLLERVLKGTDVHGLKKEELIASVLRPYFGQLSIFAFEQTYEVTSPDTDACTRSLLVDLFEPSSIAS